MARTALSRAVVSVVLFIAVFGAGKAHAQKPRQFDTGQYYYGIYYGPGLHEFTKAPYYFIDGKPSYDVSTYKWVDHILHDLQPLGINLATLADIVSEFGTIYRSDDPGIQYDETWQEVKEPVVDFLNATHKYGMDACLSTLLFPEPGEKKLDLKATEALVRDIMKRYGKYPSFKLLTPPIESRNEDFTPKNMHQIARMGEFAKPDLKMMDFPRGAGSASSLRAVIDTGLSPYVDIENIQFKAALPALFENDFMGVRGLAMAMVGAVPNKTVMIHTHYPIATWMIGMIPEQAYHVRQGAVSTATPDGMHLFNYLEFMYGTDFREGKETLWRRIKWFEGILDIQRIVPYYSHAENVAPVAVMLPRNPALGGARLISLSWFHLAKKGIPVRFFLDDRNAGRPDIVLVPSIDGLSKQQITYLRSFTLGGGTTVAMTGRAKAAKDSDPVDMFNTSPRLNQIFGLYIRSDVWDTNTPAYWKFPFHGIRNAFGAGNGVILNDYPASYPIALPAVVNEFLSKKPHFEARQLPNTYVVERWFKKDPVPMDMVLFLATDPNASTKTIDLDVPTTLDVRTAYLLDSNRVEKLKFKKTETGISTQVSDLGQYALVILAGPQGAVPILRPRQVTEIRQLGDQIPLAVELWNTNGQAISGKLEVVPPEGWNYTAKDRPDFRLAPEEKRTFQLTLSVPPKGLERKPYFIQYKTLGLVQRTMIVPDNAPEEIISDRQPPSEGKGFTFGRTSKENNERGMTPR